MITGKHLMDCIVKANTPERTDRHVISGTIKVDGEGKSRRVAVFTRDTLQQVATTMADEQGNWKIEGIPEYSERRLFVVAFDDAGEHNAEIADFISQVAGENE